MTRAVEGDGLHNMQLLGPTKAHNHSGAGRRPRRPQGPTKAHNHRAGERGHSRMMLLAICSPRGLQRPTTTGGAWEGYSKTIPPTISSPRRAPDPGEVITNPGSHAPGFRVPAGACTPFPRGCVPIAPGAQPKAPKRAFEDDPLDNLQPMAPTKAQNHRVDAQGNGKWHSSTMPLTIGSLSSGAHNDGSGAGAQGQRI